MNQPTTDTRIRAIVARIAKREDPQGFALEADIYRDLGVESTAALDLLLSLEEEFGVSLGDDAFAQAKTVGDLVALVNKENPS
jgi:acyl carrier protein